MGAQQDVYGGVIAEYTTEQRVLARRRAVALQRVSKAVEKGVIKDEAYMTRHSLMVEEELRKEVARVLMLPNNTPPLRYNAEVAEVYLSDWPIRLDTRALTEDGRVVLFVGLKCELCGRRTFHHFASKKHFEELIGITGPIVTDERRKAKDVRRREADKCVFCANGTPPWVIL